MQNLLQKAYELLKKDERLVSNEWELLKNKIQELSYKLDEKLIDLLYSDETIRWKFFKKINEVWLFDGNRFVKFINNKEFLPDSYTSFKNKIGLVDSKEDFIADKNDVVLNRPYKDCILAGWQDTEDAKRDEIFYNEVLASDEIDRLLDPKVFTNFKKYDKDGEHEFTERTKDENWDIKDNMIIKGNNLLALHSLKKKFAGKVKLIYIDPPYNTGNDWFNYNDKFNHSTWLTFMKNRLEVARELLRDDGSIFVHCDDNEQAYLKVLMDEIFWKENFRECIALKTSTPSWVNAINVKRWERLFKLKEYILFFSKNSNCRFNPIYIKAEYNINYRFEVKKGNNSYSVKDLRKNMDKEELEKYCLQNAENIYSLEKNNKKAWEKIKKVIEESKENTDVIEYTNTKWDLVLIYDWWVFVPLRDRIVNDWKNIFFGTLISDFWDDEIFQSNKSEWWVDFANAKKSEKLIKRVLDLWTKENDIVLDFFLWSWTTCAVAHKMWRQYIWIEQMDYIENITIERMKKVIEWEEWWITNTVNRKWWGSFVYMELFKKNKDYIEQIIQKNMEWDLITLYNIIKETAFVNYKFNFNDFEKNIEDFKKLSLVEMKKTLIEMIEKNAYYLNKSDLNGKDINQKIVSINNLFYE